MKNKYLIILTSIVLFILCGVLLYLTVIFTGKDPVVYTLEENNSIETSEKPSTEENLILPDENDVEEQKEFEEKSENTISEETKKEEDVTKEQIVAQPKKKAATKKVTTKKYNLKYEYYKKVSIKKIIKEDVKGYLDTTKLGKFTKKVKVKNITHIINYKVVDTTPPVIMGGNKTVYKGEKVKLVNKFLCGDNYDDVPKCKIIGDYDLNKVGKYNLKYKATDSSGNTRSIKFTLTVKEKPASSGSSSSSSGKTKKPISGYIKKYKNKNTMIGIDVSSWQDEIDWEKAKAAGVEFAIIRIGFGHTNSGEIKMDKQFKNNIKNAKAAGVKVGLYFFSYAENEKQAKQHAEWIVEQLDGEKLDLPIAFDWENWNSFNSYKMSFTRLNNSCQTFIDTVQKYGYKGMLYGSAYYLNRFWWTFKNTWVAYYTSNNDFDKPYMLWQATSSGKVDGVPGYVDIDILYPNKIK